MVHTPRTLELLVKQDTVPQPRNGVGALLLRGAKHVLHVVHKALQCPSPELEQVLWGGADK